MFFKGSRYAEVGEQELTDATGRVIRYKKVRVIPPTPASMGYRVRQGDRLDHIAYHYYRDPERFWRICDANRVMRPTELTSDVGQVILIPPAQD